MTNTWTVNPAEVITAEMKAAEAQAQTLAAYEAAIQAHIDATARSKQFADGVTLASYVASTVAGWAAQAQAFVAWRDSVWTYVYAEMDKVLAGTIPPPSVEEILSDLPEIVWP